MRNKTIKNNIGTEDWKAMYEALTPETRASIEKMRRLDKQAKPGRHIELELNSETVYEKNIGDDILPEDPESMKRP